MRLKKRRVSTKLLIVGDNDDSREILSAQLGRLGYNVRVAPDALAGEKMAVTEMPDLIIMDLELPSMVGIEAAARLKENPKTAAIPVIAYCVDAETYWGTADTAGIATYLIKPASPEVFRDIIEKVISKKSRMNTRGPSSPDK